MDKFINEHYNDIQQILVPPEMIGYFELSEFYSSLNGGKYKGKMIRQNNWLSAKQINFVFKSNKITFNVPYLHGIYPDEQHD
ncbi:MAG: hypothetical protein PF487_04365 [Bacteroidales bacterium]|nr:hypothetical protein [Bacteroidales bacterium]